MRVLAGGMVARRMLTGMEDLKAQMMARLMETGMARLAATGRAAGLEERLFPWISATSSG